MSISKYHKQNLVNIGTEVNPIMHPHSRSKRVLRDAKTGDSVKVASDRVYLVASDGSLRSTKIKTSKKERRLQRENK